MLAKESNDFLGSGNDFTISGSQPTTTTTSGPLDHFSFSPIAQQAAGVGFPVTVKAYDACGTLKADYAGGALLGGLANAPTGQAPGYGALVFSGGSATATVTAYLAGAGQMLTVTDGAVSASTSFTVLPGALTSFVLGVNGAIHAAGVASPLTATARDQWQNVKTDYQGGATVAGDLGASTKGCGSGASSPCSPVYGVLSFTNGIGSGSVTGYKVETGRTVTVTDGSVTAQSTPFDIGPGALASLDFSAIPAQSAGVAFPVTVTASDAYGNVKVDYAGAPALVGTLGASTSGCGSGGSDPCQPAYGTLSFVSGVATSNVTAFNVESGRTLSVTDGPVTGTSSPFDVTGGTVSLLLVGVQPTDTLFGVVITPAITVSAVDSYGNPAQTTVTIAIGTNPSGGALSGTTSCPTSGGVATFDDLSINEPGLGYTLVVTVGSTVITTSQFDIVNVEVDCSTHPTQPCVGSTGTDTNAQTTTAAQVFAPAGGNPGTLSIALVDFVGACPNGSGDSVVVDPPTGHGSNNPVQITVEYDKSVAPGTGVANFVFCLEKSGGVVIEPVPACKQHHGHSKSGGYGTTYPCIDKRSRDNAGDLLVKFLVTDDPVITKR